MGKPSRRKNRQARKSAPGHRLNRAERIANKNKRRENLAVIRADVKATGSSIEPLTQAHNRKCNAQNIKEQQLSYEEPFAAQIKAWRSMLPTIIKHFVKIKEPREPGKIKHSMESLMLLGLLMFIFRIQ